jgi:hypothetical protein
VAHGNKKDLALVEPFHVAAHVTMTVRSWHMEDRMQKAQAANRASDRQSEVAKIAVTAVTAAAVGEPEHTGRALGRHASAETAAGTQATSGEVQEGCGFIEVEFEEDPSQHDIKEDSDVDQAKPDESGADSLRKDELSRRNKIAMAKHSVIVLRSVQQPGAGMGLFSTKQLKPGTVIPIKTIWFGSAEEACAFSRRLPPARLHERMIRASVKNSPVIRFGVVTGIAGFVNDSQKIGKRSCDIVAQPWAGWGTHAIALKVTSQIPRDRELLTSYGPGFRLPAVPDPVELPKRARRTKAQIGE